MAKIGIDCRLWNETGVGRYTRNLVKQLTKVDTNNTYILFLRKNEYDTVSFPAKNFEKRLADIHWHTFEEQIQFPKILKKEQLDLIHFPYFSVPVFYKGKFIVTIHDLILNHFPTGKASTLPSFIYWIKQVAYRYIVNYAIRKSQRILTVSHATEGEIEKHYHISRGKILVTYEGVDSNLIHTNTKISAKTPYFLYVGNAYPHKNLERLLFAFQEFKQKTNKNVYLYMIGKEDFFWKRIQQKVSQLELSDNIFFLQSIPDQSLSAYYKNAQGIILPSLMEGFGLPALEAMVNNCLVIASKIAAFEEVCKDAAIYFDPLSTKSLVEILEKIDDHKINVFEKKKKGLLYAKKFSWEKMAKETVKAYESCINI